MSCARVPSKTAHRPVQHHRLRRRCHHRHIHHHHRHHRRPSSPSRRVLAAFAVMAANGAATLPPLVTLTSLFGKVTRQYEHALKTSSVFFYPSKVSVLSQNVSDFIPSSSPSASSSTIVPWTVRCVPALLDKAKEKRKGNTAKPNASVAKDSTGQEQNAADVFAPPYQSDLLVEELPQHTILLNKFCVVPKHFLLVTRHFQPQTMPPAPDMLAIGYRILVAHQRLARSNEEPNVSSGTELLAFYNCGQMSGASQPHQHMQFAELGSESDETAKRTDTGTLPIERLLHSIPSDGKERDVFALPLPHQHFVSLIKTPPVDDDERLQEYLGMKLLSLLDALFQARMTAAAAAAAGAQAGTSSGPGLPQAQRPSSPSWNLLITLRAMHLIPRQREDFDGLREMVQQEGTSHVEDDVDLVGTLSVNSLGYAGHLLVKSEAELDYLRRYPGGVAEVLRQTGTPPVIDFTTATEAATVQTASS